jgi:hypothetical protein
MTNIFKISEEISSPPYFLSVSFNEPEGNTDNIEKILYSHKIKQSTTLLAQKILSFIKEQNKNNSINNQSIIHSDKSSIFIKSIDLNFHSQLKQSLDKLNEIYVSPDFSHSDSKQYSDDTVFINKHLEHIFSYIHLDLSLRNENRNQSKKLKL